MHIGYIKVVLFFSLLVLLVECAYAQEEGLASYYHNKFHGRRTASGVKYDKMKYMAAHREYPFGTYLKVTNLKNMKSVIVEVTDRGPHRKSRIVDLSYAAAEKIDMVRSGLLKVRIVVVPAPFDYTQPSIILPPILNIKQNKDSVPFVIDVIEQTDFEISQSLALKKKKRWFRKR